ncbi:MAG: hypothetical protein AB1509_15680 [Chloroflexota bacterium]|jgi:hypothetical protein
MKSPSNIIRTGYVWKVVHDPTRKGYEPGMFYGGHFRWSDIELPLGCNEIIPCPFPNGTVFENIRTGERVKIRRGKAVRLEVQHGGIPNRRGASCAVGDSRQRVHAGAG